MAHDQSLVCLEALLSVIFGFSVWEAERYEGFVIHRVLWEWPGSGRSWEWEHPFLVLLS